MTVFRLWRILSGLLVVLLVTPAMAQPVDRCEALGQHRDVLMRISDSLGRDGLSDSAARDLLDFRNAFQATVRSSGLVESVESLAVGAGTSVIASIALGGPPGWAAAGLGAALGLSYTKATDFLTHFGAWRQIDANTALYQYVLDYVEYGRVGPVTDDLMRFAGQHAGVLQAATGAAPPQDGKALSLYLRAHGAQLLMFFGTFEEKVGSDAFPRHKFPDSAGRYGPSRLSAGYYRQVLGQQIREELNRLDAEIARLVAGGCDVVAATEPQCPVPQPGQTAICVCELAAVSGRVWGTDLYTSDSSPCRAAAHAGLVRPAALPDGSIRFVGATEIAGAAGCPYYTSSTAFGITSDAWNGWHASFYFPAAQRGLCEESSPPATGLWYCPTVLPDGTADLRCHCTPDAIASQGSVWGTQVYTSDSAICPAARHAGAVGVHGGSIRVLRLNGLDSYEGSERNGISTYGFRSWPSSIGFP